MGHALLHAQELNIFHFPDYDTNYVNIDWDRWSVRTYSIRESKPFTLYLDDRTHQITYQTNNRYSAGIGLAYKFLLLDVGIGLPIEKDRPTNRIDFQGYLTLNSWDLELYTHIYRGFEVEDPHDQGMHFREDVKSSLFGMNFYYSFNHRYFSRQSIISGTHTQKKSAGSLVLGGYAFFHQINADSSLVPTRHFPDYPGDTYITRSDLFTPGVSIGYGYFFALPKNFFVFAGIIPGLGVTLGEVKADNSFQPPMGLSGRVNIRSSIGYNSSRFYALVSVFNDHAFIHLGNDNHLRYDPGRAKLILGWRFYKKIKELEGVNRAIQQL